MLFRIIRCLDCLEVPTRQDNDCMSIMTSRSPVNEEIMEKVRLLDSLGYSQTAITDELKFLYGNHVIANSRDRFKRT